MPDLVPKRTLILDDLFHDHVLSKSGHQFVAEHSTKHLPFLSLYHMSHLINSQSVLEANDDVILDVRSLVEYKSIFVDLTSSFQ